MNALHSPIASMYGIFTHTWILWVRIRKKWKWKIMKKKIIIFKFIFSSSIPKKTQQQSYLYNFLHNNPLLGKLAVTASRKSHCQDAPPLPDFQWIFPLVILATGIQHLPYELPPKKGRQSEKKTSCKQFVVYAGCYYQLLIFWGDGICYCFDVPTCSNRWKNQLIPTR